MSRDSFIQSYTAAFLASVAAQKYMEHSPGNACNDPPVEDALFCAEEAWTDLQKHRPAPKLTLHHDGQEEYLGVYLGDEALVEVNYDSHGSSALSLVAKTARFLAERAGWEVEEDYGLDDEEGDSE